MAELPGGVDLRTFPLRLEPLAGEAFDSWLEAMASRMHASIGELVGPLGLPRHRARKGSISPNWTVCMRLEERQNVERVTGVTESQLRDMTLERWHPHIVEIDPPLRGIRIRSSWALAASRYCPECLAESAGRWRLSWRLGWTFACERHQLLLVDRCPQCGGRPRLHPHPRHRVPKPGRCVLPLKGTGTRCGFLFSDTPALSLVSAPDILAAQSVLRSVTEGVVEPEQLPLHADAGVTAGLVLADLRAVFRRLMPNAVDADFASWASAPLIDSSRRFLKTDVGVDATGGVAPRDAATTALGLTAAVRMLGAPSTAEAGSRMIWLLERTNGNRYLTLSGVSNWTNRGSSSVLREVLLSPAKQRLSTCGLTGEHNASALLLLKRDSTNALERARATPAMLWKRWALCLAPPSHTRPRTLWRVLAVLLVQSGTQLAAAEVARLLGSDLSFETLNYSTRRIISAPSGGNVRQALACLADLLDREPPPIDYARRRVAFSEVDQLVSSKRWEEIGEQARPSQGAALQASRWVYEELTGNPAEVAPGAMRLTGRGLAPYREFRRCLSPAQVTGLRRLGEELLSERGIEEPLTWDPGPPSMPLHGLDLPGSDPDSIDVELVSRLTLAEALYPKQIAERLGTTVDHIRYVQERQSINWSGKLQKSRPLGQAETWRRLYVEERWTLQRISASFSVSQRDISQKLRSMGVEIRVPGVGHYSDSVSEVVRRYSGEQQTAREISEGLGVPKWVVYRILDNEGVERRNTGPQPGCEAGADDVARRYARGDSMRAIREATGFSIVEIRRFVNRSQVPRPRPRRRSPHQHRAAEVASRYVKDGESLAAISRATGLASTTIRGLLVTEGVSLRPPGRKPLVSQVRTRKPSPYENKISEIVTRYRNGDSAAEVSRRAGVPDWVVRDILKREGLTLRRGRGVRDRSPLKKHVEEVVRRHTVENRKVSEISKVMGISEHSVRYILQKEGVLRLRKPITAQQEAEVVRLFMDDGESIKAISRLTGLGVAPVRRLIASAKARQVPPSSP